MRLPLFVFYIAFFLLAPLYGQQDSTTVSYDEVTLEIQEITNADLQKYRIDPDFNYEIVTSDPTWWNDFTAWLGNVLLRVFESIFGMEKASGFLSMFLELVPYLLLILLIYLLIKFFLKLNANNLKHTKGSKNLVNLSEEEHIIKNENIQKLINDAVATKNFRLAIRYYYLYVLRLLSEKDLIVWELQKTNNDYLKEIELENLKQQFSKITRLYDYIWYGDFAIDESKFQRAEKEFQSLKLNLESNG
ncbi:DUF4129 domain-containing protein [Pseudozobellia sp. WGM2]|uniref:DUF4129 domain-containing protein n=1 Tax=Pseudozobellia sp. WGM2 TaxID=2787625 RepID=UPI001AE0D667|nr:DUF4129 domain-containing protein [Pseudozobellia sp. WGM2]